jgi:hypothetical protein
MRVALALVANVYRYVLKRHSKKSPYRPDVANWFESIVSNFIPRDPASVGCVLDTLNDQNTRVIGGEGQYLSLKVWLGGTFRQ